MCYCNCRYERWLSYDDCVCAKPRDEDCPMEVDDPDAESGEDDSWIDDLYDQAVDEKLTNDK